MCGAVVGKATITCCLQRRRPVIGRLYRLTDKMCLTNPGPLCMWKDNADCMAISLECRHKRVNVWRRLV